MPATRLLQHTANQIKFTVYRAVGDAIRLKGTIFGPAYALGLNPLLHFMTITNSDELARASSQKCRDLVTSPEYQQRFPHGLGIARESSWTLRGWNLYTSAAFTRLSPQGRQIVLQARFHSDDLPGRLLKLAQSDPKATQWTVVVLAATNDGEDSYVLDTDTSTKRFLKPYAALWPSRYPAEQLQQIRSTIGEPLWNGLYMQRPTLGEAQIFRAECFTSFVEPRATRLVVAWDTASRVQDGNAYSVGVTLAVTPESNFQILEVVRGRWEFGELVRQVWQAHQRAFQMTGLVPEACVIEAASSGIALIQELRDCLPIIEIKPKGAKIVRAESIAPMVNNGWVGLPQNASWRDTFLRELSEFPLGEFADQCDALTHALSYFSRPAEFTPVVTEELMVMDADDIEFDLPSRVCPELDEWEEDQFGNGPPRPSTAMALDRMRRRGSGFFG